MARSYSEKGHRKGKNWGHKPFILFVPNLEVTKLPIPSLKNEHSYFNQL
jgi:hypothetical protein